MNSGENEKKKTTLMKGGFGELAPALTERAEDGIYRLAGEAHPLTFSLASIIPRLIREHVVFSNHDLLLTHISMKKNTRENVVFCEIEVRLGLDRVANLGLLFSTLGSTTRTPGYFF
jgi:hypothetical protein